MGIGNILIGKKLIGGYVVISLLALLIGAVGIGYMKKIAADNAALYENVTLPIADQGSIAGEFNRVRVNMGKMLLEQNSASIAEYDRKIEGFEKSIKRNLDDSITRADSEEIKNLAQGFQEKYSLFSTSVQELNALAKAGQWSEAKQLFNGSCQESSLSANDALVKLQEASVAHAKVVSDTVKTAQQQAVMIMTVIIIACIALALLIGILLSRSITVPLERGMHMMQELKKGHLKERLSMNRKDEIGMLAETMDVYAEELSSNVVRIMDRIADGDVSMNIVPQDDKDEVSPAMKKIVNTL